MPIQALGNNLIIKIDFEKVNKNSNEIELTVNKKQKPNIGIVISIGEQVSRSVIEGDKVVFHTHGLVPLNNVSDELFLVNENNLLAIIGENYE